MSTMTSTTAPGPTFDRTALDRLLAGRHSAGWVADLRRASCDHLAGLALPDRRSENWMRTDLRLFKPHAWSLRDAPPPHEATRTVPSGLLAGFLADRKSVV